MAYYICFWSSFGHETWPINMSWEITFLGKILHGLSDWVLNSGPFAIYQLTKVNQKLIMMSLWFSTFLKVCNEMIKNCKHQPQINKLIAIIKGSGTSFDFLQ